MQTSLCCPLNSWNICIYLYAYLPTDLPLPLYLFIYLSVSLSVCLSTVLDISVNNMHQRIWVIAYKWAINKRRSRIFKSHYVLIMTRRCVKGVIRALQGTQVMAVRMLAMILHWWRWCGVEYNIRTISFTALIICP